jgi:MerR family copper efflux transcriptional regulator
MAHRMLQIGEVAERVGISLRTVRYYEEMGLLAPAERTPGGFRLYTEAHVDRLGLIARLKSLGFSVGEMRELLEARDALHGDDADVDERFFARARLKRFASTASARCDELRRQLAHAEELAGQLRREARRHPVGAER